MLLLYVSKRVSCHYYRYDGDMAVSSLVIKKEWWLMKMPWITDDDRNMLRKPLKTIPFYMRQVVQKKAILTGMMMLNSVQ